MKKPYIKKYSSISKFAIWIVDGAYIRKNIDIDFTNFGQHYRFKFIPEDEFWIDEEHGGKEEHFFIQHLLVENRLMAEGATYPEAIVKADSAERAERMKNKFIQRELKAKKHKIELIRKIHKNFIGVYSNQDIKVWVVDGKIVRNVFFIDFTEGGHDLVYSFIPHGEIWLDDDLSQEERKFVLLHEIHERNLMAKGLDYASSHKDSSKIEHSFRMNPKNIQEKIKEELKISNPSFPA